MLLIAFAVIASTLVVLWLLDHLKVNTKGRYVLVTGCDTGFGNALAKSLDKKGCHVFATCMTTKGAQDLASASSDRLKTVIMDVTKSESIEATFGVVRESIPRGKGLWGIVNNAGITGNFGYYDWYKRDEFRQILEVNLLGPVEVTNVFLPLVKKVKGRIVNMSSGVAVSPISIGGYEMSKSGMEAYSDCLRQQMDNYSVSVHIIQPGFFVTPVTNKERSDDKLDMVWDRMPEAQRQEYGRECIDEYKQEVRKILDTSDPRLYLVTDAIEHALFARFPWRRYPIGGLIRFVARPCALMPACIGDAVRKLAFPVPKPNSCKYK